MNLGAKSPKTSRRLDRALSEVEREIATDAGLCWQCDAPLGTTEKCLMCAAKRAEDRVVGTGSAGGSGILVMGGSAPAAGSIIGTGIGTGTADETLAEFVERTEGAPHPILGLLK